MSDVSDDIIQTNCWPFFSSESGEGKEIKCEINKLDRLIKLFACFVKLKMTKRLCDHDENYRVRSYTYHYYCRTFG